VASGGGPRGIADNERLIADVLDSQTPPLHAVRGEEGLSRVIERSNSRECRQHTARQSRFRQGRRAGEWRCAGSASAGDDAVIRSSGGSGRMPTT